MKGLMRDLRRDARPRQVAGALQRFWRRHTGAIAWFSLVILAAVGYWAVHREGQTRGEQFCTLELSRHQDNVDRITQTIDYFASPVGQAKTTFNTYILQISVPQQIADVVEEESTIPAVCDQYRDEDYSSRKEVFRAIHALERTVGADALAGR